MKTVVIIPAGGSGKRLGAEIPKQFLPLANIPVLARTLLAFEHSSAVSSIVVAVQNDCRSRLEKLVGEYGITKLHALAEGGTERQDSIRNAMLTEVVQQADVILVHDAVRPFVSAQCIENIVLCAAKYGAVIPALPPKETIKIVSEENHILQTPNRASLRAAQTPQGFRRNVLFHAYQYAEEHNISGTDDASLAEAAGFSVLVIPGEDENIKITTPMDFRLAELLCTEKNNY